MAINLRLIPFAVQSNARERRQRDQVTSTIKLLCRRSSKQKTVRWAVKGGLQEENYEGDQSVTQQPVTADWIAAVEAFKRHPSIQSSPDCCLVIFNFKYPFDVVRQMEFQGIQIGDYKKFIEQWLTLELLFVICFTLSVASSSSESFHALHVASLLSRSCHLIFHSPVIRCRLKATTPRTKQKQHWAS